MDIPREDLALLVRDKYDGDATRVTEEDRARLTSGEPLAYVIGWVPFLGLRIELASKPLIPRPETEWWTELLIERLKVRFAGAPFRLLDVCAGSGAVGLAVLDALPESSVSFGELHADHSMQILENLRVNGIDPARADVRTGDLFAPFPGQTFDVIVANPPYIPEARETPESVHAFEPHEALYAGADGLSVIRRLADEAGEHLPEGGELWAEVDTEHVKEAAALFSRGGATRTLIRTDLYGRDRLVLAYY